MEHLHITPDPQRRIPFRWGRKIMMIAPADIVFIRADGNHSELFLASGDPMPCERGLKALEPMLRPLNFMRTHKSWLVNLQWVRCMDLSTCRLRLLPIEHDHPTNPTPELSRRRAAALERVIRNG